MKFIPDEQIEWVNVPMIKDDWRLPDSPHQYNFILPRPLADWDVFDYWEKARLDSMKAHLKQGDTLFDIGTEQGWCNLIYASFVGPENMVLIEPTKEFWANIRKTWEKNYPDTKPKAFWSGLFGKRDNGEWLKSLEDWPQESNGQIIDRNKYQYLHEHSEDIEEITLDQFVALSGIVPDALTMDVEGAELLILQGARETLETFHPKVWVSIHPDLGKRDYGITKDETLRFMELLGYKGEHLSTDHEEHWYFV